MSQPQRLGDVSFWYQDMLGGLPKRRAALSEDITADVCIIGAGYSGLWTAWYLKEAAPHLNIVILEKDFAGFGASGRNGGWLTGGFAWNHARYAARSGPEAVKQMAQLLHGAVDEVIAVAQANNIDADILRTDELMVAVNSAQMIRMKEEAAYRSTWGEEERISELSQSQLRQRIAIPGALGAMLVRGVARVQPAKLVQGLARAVERAGVRIFEESPALSISPGLVPTPQGQVRAAHILRCTEGFTASLPGLGREWLPLNSAQIVTEPLPDHIWQQIGWQGHELIGDAANSYCYCQRTREGRIAVGGRGLPYLFGSKLDDNGRPDQTTIQHLKDILARHFPAAKDARIDHAWCGVLGVPRDWCATLGYDAQTGLGWTGGYVGVGVSTSNLAGRALRDLVLGRQTALTALPLVNRKTKSWEPEPLRWAGVHGMYALLNAADRAEAKARCTKPSILADLGRKLAGR